MKLSHFDIEHTISGMKKYIEFFEERKKKERSKFYKQHTQKHIDELMLTMSKLQQIKTDLETRILRQYDKEEFFV